MKVLLFSLAGILMLISCAECKSTEPYITEDGVWHIDKLCPGDEVPLTTTIRIE